MSDVLQELKRDIQNGVSYYEHIASDVDVFEGKQILYNFDFSLLHPFLFPSTDKKNPQYESVGRNIFSLLSLYHNSCGFKPVFSVPSLLEFLDVLAHRIDRLDQLANNPDRLKKIASDLKKVFQTDSEHDELHKERVRSILINLRVSSGNGNLARFLGMLEQSQIATIRDYTDPDVFSHKDFLESQESILNRMSSRRAINDKRHYDDRLFHYKVDTWNIAAALWSERLNNTEINHVCRSEISQYFPNSLRSLYSRSPFVPLIRLFSLLRASPEGDIQRESGAFVELGCQDLNKSLKILSEFDSIDKVSPVEAEEINRIYNKFLRPLFYDYSRDKEGIVIQKARQQIEEQEMNTYKSILTEEGLKERFKADTESLRESARSLVNQKPIIVEERLLGEYNLDNNPRVQAIRKKLGI